MNINNEDIGVSSFQKRNSLIEYFDCAVNTYDEKNSLIDLRRNINCKYSEIKEDVYCSAYGLNTILNKRERVHCAIISENSALYVISYFSIVNSNNIAILIDKDLNEETMYKQLDFADVEILFISELLSNRIDNILKNCSKINKIVILGEDKNKKGNYSFFDLICIGRDNQLKANEYHKNLRVNINSLCEIIFTSGTTGANKGVMLSQKNICCSIYGSMERIRDTGCTLAVLPFHHSFAFSCQVLSRFVCGTTIYINEDFMHLAKNLKKYPISTMVAVPMILDSLASRIIQEVKKVNAIKYMETGFFLEKALRIIGIDAREFFFKPILKRFNPNFRTIIVGGAPIKVETYNLFTSIGFNVIVGYGISECSPLVSVNYQRKKQYFNCGQAINNMSIKIANKDNDNCGEILVKGDGVMLGYYKDKASSNCVIDCDGWFHTGDIGFIDNRKMLHILGRSKNLIILSNGKNIHPEEMEDLLSSNISYIKEVMVYTTKKQNALFAKVFLYESFTEGKTKKEIQTIMNNKLIEFNKKMPSYKRINDIIISENELIKNSSKKIIRSANM